MRRKDIEKNLRTLAESSSVPNEMEETYRLVKQIPQNPEPKKKGWFERWGWKALTGTASAVAAGFAAFFVIDSLSGPGTVPGPIDESSERPVTTLPSNLEEKEATAIGKQAASLLNLAGVFDADANTLALRASRHDRDEQVSTADLDSAARDIDGFIDMVADFSEDDWVIDLVAEEYKISVADGEDTFEIEYEETQISAYMHTFSGTIAVSDTQIPFEGMIEDLGPSGREVEMSITIGDERIEVEQEIEQGENEYSFSFFRSGSSVPYKTIEFENEVEGIEGESSIEIFEQGIETECEFEYLANSADGSMGNRFFAEYSRESSVPSVNSVEAEVNISKNADGTHTYTFEGGHSITI